MTQIIFNMRIFIPGNVPSSKNSKQIVRRGNRSILIWSKTALKYVEVSKDEWESHREEVKRILESKEKPYRIYFHFVRGSRRKYDFVNPLQTVQDLMVRYGYIDDDNTTEMFPFPLEINGKLETYSKDNPGVYIEF